MTRTLFSWENWKSVHTVAHTDFSSWNERHKWQTDEKKKSRLGRHWLFKSFSSDIKLPLSIKDLHVLQVILLITPLHAPHNHQPTLLNHHGMTSPARVEAGQWHPLARSHIVELHACHVGLPSGHHTSTDYKSRSPVQCYLGTGVLSSRNCHPWQRIPTSYGKEQFRLKHEFSKTLTISVSLLHLYPRTVWALYLLFPSPQLCTTLVNLFYPVLLAGLHCSAQMIQPIYH